MEIKWNTKTNPKETGWYTVTVQHNCTGEKIVGQALWKQRQGGNFSWFRHGVNYKVIAWLDLKPYEGEK